MNFWIHDGFLDSQWICGFTVNLWLHDGFLDSRWISGFTVESSIHDGLLDSRCISDSRWISGFTMFAKDSCSHHGFLDSRWIFGFAMDLWIRDGSVFNIFENSIYQGRPGTARNGGPADLWHGTARKIMARKNIGTARHEKSWHGKILARHGPDKYQKMFF